MGDRSRPFPGTTTVPRAGWRPMVQWSGERWSSCRSSQPAALTFRCLKLAGRRLPLFQLRASPSVCVSVCVSVSGMR